MDRVEENIQVLSCLSLTTFHEFDSDLFKVPLKTAYSSILPVDIDNIPTSYEMYSFLHLLGHTERK